MLQTIACLKFDYVFLPNDVCSLLRHFYLKLYSFSNHNLIVIQQFSDGDRRLCNAHIWYGDV